MMCTHNGPNIPPLDRDDEALELVNSRPWVLGYSNDPYDQVIKSFKASFTPYT